MFKKILLAVDGSEESKLAESYAVELAKKFDSSITIINVVDISLIYISGKDEKIEISDSKIREILKAESGKMLNEIKERLEKEVKEVNIVIRFGKPWNEIVEESKNYDLIVMGSRGLTGIKRILIGSNAESVLRYAKCPVLVVKKE
ncbi:MAG: universal stress protein [Candidatus Altarchaeaceae archaeon]